MSAEDDIQSLPIEILHLVIDEFGSNLGLDLDPKSKSTLLSCALVCRSFRYRAQKHLFSTIQILTDDSWPARLDRLLAIFNSNCMIAPSVRSLTLDLEHLREVTPHDSLSISTSPFPTLFSKFCGLRHFSWTNDWSKLRWSSLDEALILALDGLFRSPSLTSIVLESIHVPLSIFTACVNLTSIRLLNCDSEPSEPTSLPTITNTPLLKSASFCGSSSLVQEIYSRTHMFSKLKDIHVSLLTNIDVHMYWELMLATCDTLEHLDLSGILVLDPSPDLVLNFMDIGRLYALRSFDIIFTISVRNRDPSIFPMPLYEILNPQISPSKLENISIKLGWLCCTIGNELKYFESGGWKLLDELLSGDKFPSLKQVTFDFYFGYGDGRPGQDALPELQNTLKVLKDNASRCLPLVSASETTTTIITVDASEHDVPFL